MDFAYDRGDLVAYYRNYEQLMAHWRSVLPADRFFEIQNEELVADREQWTRKMIEFSGLDWDDACLHSERNGRPLRTASVWQARQPAYQTSVARWRHYEPWLGCLRAPPRSLIGNHETLAGVTLSATGPSRRFAALRNLVAIGA